jgi:hypothetical protein
MAAPSNLPSARAVAERCFDKYRLESDPNCDIALRSTSLARGRLGTRFFSTILFNTSTTSERFSLWNFSRRFASTAARLSARWKIQRWLIYCRRLLSTSTEGGRRLDIDLGPQGSTNVVNDVEIPPMPVGVLRGSSGLQVVGGA